MKGVYLNFLDPKTRNERLTKDWNYNLELKNLNTGENLCQILNADLDM